MAMFLARALNGGLDPGTPCASAPFADVPADSAFCPHVEFIRNAGVTLGCGGNLFCPNQNVTRLQMAVFLARALNGGNPTELCTAAPFTDILASDPSCPHIQFIKNRVPPVTVGNPDGTYRPFDNITRWQMALFLGRAFLLIP